MNNKILVEIQYFSSCPNSLEMLNRVKKAIEGLEDVELVEKLVETAEVARAVGFRGSPTVLINGVDLEGLPEPFNPSLSCRIYPNGLPTIEQICSIISNYYLKTL